MIPSLFPPLLRTMGSNNIFFYFLPSYSSLKRGNNISTRISFLKAETMIFLVLGAHWVFCIRRSEPQAHPHGQRSHASGRPVDFCPPFLPYFPPCTALVFLSLFGKVDFTVSDPCFLFFKYSLEAPLELTVFWAMCSLFK